MSSFEQFPRPYIPPESPLSPVLEPVPDDPCPRTDIVVENSKHDEEVRLVNSFVLRQPCVSVAIYTMGLLDIFAAMEPL